MNQLYPLKQFQISLLVKILFGILKNILRFTFCKFWIYLMNLMRFYYEYFQDYKQKKYIYNYILTFK